jgi:EAL domain-containing protein (putative c-di-GMP-specific phosphodiesterase class I)
MSAQVDIKQNIEYSFKELVEYTRYANEYVNDLNIFWDLHEDYFPPYSEFFGNINTKLIDYLNKMYNVEYEFTNNVIINETSHIDFCLKIKEKNNKLITDIKNNINLCKNNNLLEILKTLIEDLLKIDDELISAINSNYKSLQKNGKPARIDT